MRYNSTLSLPSAVDGVGNQSHAPAALPLERTATQCIGGLVGSTGPFWEGKENLPPPPRFEPRTVQLIASRYTN